MTSRKKVTREKPVPVDLGERVTQVLKEWEAEPGKLFEWRSKMFRTILIILEDLITRPVDGNRTKENARVRAIREFQSIAAAMEEYRMDTPVVCPHCTKEFNLA